MITTIKEFENKVLLPHELNRVKPLEEQLNSNGIDFKYFATINYHYRNTNYKNVVKDNERIKKVLKKVFGVRAYFFIELHTDPEQKLYGGYHKHILIERIKPEQWMQPTSTMTNFMYELNPEMVFATKFGDMPRMTHQIALLNRVLRALCQNIPNGVLGLHTEQVTNVQGVLAYCTKQFNLKKFGKLHRWYEVLDTKNSDCDHAHLLDRYDRNRSHTTRYEKVFA